MNDILSQEEIDMLLRGDSTNDNDPDLTLEEIDVIGEIGNISMGTSATTLSTLLGKKVVITAPNVQLTTFKALAEEYPVPFVGVEIYYTEGLEGKNLLVIKDNDVKIIADLLMGGDGTNTNVELNEMHLSAISEVMNQMIGSSSTSLSTMLDKTISISPPDVFEIRFSDDKSYRDFIDDESTVVQVKFKMTVEGLIDSYIMQLLPLDFARGLVKSLVMTDDAEIIGEKPAETSHVSHERQIPEKTYEDPQRKVDEVTREQGQESSNKAVDVRPISFQPLDESEPEGHRSSIDLIMDVPLQVTVELGRTQRLIKDILELNVGSIIELDKMAGEPVDILINGKVIAKGEVVVIEDSFGVRITDIISSSKRISKLN